MITKSISGLNQTELNFIEVDINVTDFKVEKKSGLFGNDSVNFQIETEIPVGRFKHIVHRKD